MSTTSSSSKQTASGPVIDSGESNRKRPLACVLCQQRKIRCNRRSPCANCIQTGVQCVPASLAPRRRRFAERDLLQRLRYYEDVLRENNIAFEAMHTSVAIRDKALPSKDNRRSESVDDPHTEMSDEEVQTRPVYGDKMLPFQARHDFGLLIYL
jgi:hypothetical protein